MEEFQETNIFGKKSKGKKIISKYQRLTYQKTFEATRHFFKQEKQLDFSRIWNDHNKQNIRLLLKMQSPLVNFLHKGRIEGLVPDLIFIKYSL